MKHTPGPWRYVSDVGTHVIRQQRSDGEFDSYVATTWGGEHEADARLIAAAPELLEALQALLARVTRGYDGLPQGHGVRIAEAAIAKATGEPQ